MSLRRKRGSAERSWYTGREGGSGRGPQSFHQVSGLTPLGVRIKGQRPRPMTRVWEVTQLCHLGEPQSAQIPSQGRGRAPGQSVPTALKSIPQGVLAPVGPSRALAPLWGG